MRLLFLLPLLLLNKISFSQKPFAVVELFTSEGCSSCPAADVVFGKLKLNSEKSGQNVFFLAFHVDYWNKGGWKDPFSKKQFTVRQENYSRVLAEKEMYTPEAVINGETSLVGSKEDKLKESIHRALSFVPAVTLSVEKDIIENDTLVLKYSVSKMDPNYVLRIALTEDALSNHVTSGENSGKTLHHEGVVKLFTSVDMPGKTGTAKILLSDKTLTKKNKIIAFIQDKRSMKIIASDQILF